MVAVAKRKTKDALGEHDVLPNTAEWRQRVREALAKEGRGAQQRLAEYLDISSGHLADTIKDTDEPDSSRYTRHRRKIDEFFKWPAFMPLSPDTAELQHLLKGLGEDGKRLVAALRDLPADEQREKVRAFLALMTRK